VHVVGVGQGGTSGPLMALLADLTPSERMEHARGTNSLLGDLGGRLGPLTTLPLINATGFPPFMPPVQSFRCSPAAFSWRVSTPRRGTSTRRRDHRRTIEPVCQPNFNSHRTVSRGETGRPAEGAGG
jgi:hypothetical protein